MSDSNTIIDHTRDRRENIRICVLETARATRAQGCYVEQLLTLTRAVYADATALEIKRELDHLKEIGLLTTDQDASGRWFVVPTGHAIDASTPGRARGASLLDALDALDTPHRALLCLEELFEPKFVPAGSPEPRLDVNQHGLWSLLACVNARLTHDFEAAREALDSACAEANVKVAQQA